MGGAVVFMARTGSKDDQTIGGAKMVDQLRFALKNVNPEIIAKLLNPVARKYGCWVQYLPRENSLKFFGDQACFRPIVEEMLAIFFPEPAIVPVPAREKPGPVR